MVRGGGWNDFPKHIRSAYRSAFPADVPLYATGFRVVRSASNASGEVKNTSAANAKNPGNNVFYSLNGKKVTKPNKGIYIVNGEKRIIE